MSADNESVEVPFGDKPGETATLLLAAAEELGLDQSVVKVVGVTNFEVPQEVNDKAFGQEKQEAKKAPAKKAAAKKSPAKNTQE